MFPAELSIRYTNASAVRGYSSIHRMQTGTCSGPGPFQKV